MLDFTDRVAVVTGAGSGIGAAVAEKLFRLHANVELIARSETNVAAAAHRLDPALGQARFHVCDVRSEKELIGVRDDILSSRGKIDVLVTCAAAGAAAGQAEEMSLETWRSIMETDLDGVFLTCKIFGACMIRGGYGRIVNMTSFHTIATYPYRVAYNAAKSGVEGLTRALAVEWGRHGITVNAVAPGPIRTPRTTWFLSQSPDTETGMLGRTPATRIGETDDVAALVAFLASEEARHVNGQQIVIDGGWTKSAWWGDYTREGS
jgi:NAD(P)-dependent dehydrogenase (short-subunit alcohol dehydrogenase family)